MFSVYILYTQGKGTEIKKKLHSRMHDLHLTFLDAHCSQQPFCL